MSAAEKAAFVARYGGIYEHSSWVAERAWELLGGSGNAAEIAATLAHCVDVATDAEKRRLICAHPDLAGRAAVRGELTAESSGEQASAGIDQCTAEEFARFQKLNDRYKEKFGFPFVMAVRGSNRHAILAAFEERLQNDAEAEFARALSEIHKIARLRLAVQLAQKETEA
ncbi:2-oxo-4-hydroxy-4-carboxy-5-ureidoimidazoline decarboxylase [Woeseia oceani]|uniref:2-oxo-4-hydroxy-4-carboxy-5-ureidoimidazoline decarboxylase n=1 Tax=Woeseia oceani TaxID=1548547 RepID=A0A193LIP8_9GAMM|nr:2-oxo-4-hydroxy-4-carboxy-5-ureidoimidazoline decarboxylase [Woeseia oceani]ANO52382.1 OHCU decarboxylase [Woeseia oceani]